MHGGKQIKIDNRPLILAINCNRSSGGGKVMTSLAEFARNHGFRVVTASPEDSSGKTFPEHLVVTTHWQKALNWRISKAVGSDRCILY